MSLVPVLGAVGEEKTKPTQHSVQNLRAAGLTPDFLVCRSSQPLSTSTKKKLALFCHVPAAHCLGVHDLSNIYRVPLLLHAQGVTRNCLSRLQLTQLTSAGFLNEWIALAELVDSLAGVGHPCHYLHHLRCHHLHHRHRHLHLHLHLHLHRLLTSSIPSRSRRW